MAPNSTTTVLEGQQISQKSIQEEYSSDRKKHKFLFWEFETRLMWTNIIGITLFHILTVYILLTDLSLKVLGLIVYCGIIGNVGGFGVTAGAHRYWTHRTYKAKLPLKIILLFCFSLAGQNSLVEWVRDHRVHHKFSETDADPHNSRRGFFFAHVGWLMMKKHPEVIRKGRQVDCSDLLEDPLIVFYQRYFIWLKLLCCFVLPTIVPPLLWGEPWINAIKAVVIVRYIVSLNYTWLVNSAAHMWGNRPYDKNIRPVENLVVSFLTLGEGYHNYHHTFPWDYRAAEIGKSFNITTHVLNFFEKIGWAYDMKSPTSELVMKVIENKGDGSHYKWGCEVPEPNEKAMTKVS